MLGEWGRIAVDELLWKQLESSQQTRAESFIWRMHYDHAEPV